MAKIAFENSFAELPEGFYARVHPDEVPAPRLRALNTELAETLRLDVDWLRSSAGLGMLSGNEMPAGSDPLAMIYAGHQFGGFSPQLGDGRAILLGEVIGRDGIRRDIQLKGAGRTPFSRQGDGKSPLGPVLREYLVSEAMAAFGVPTTRALAAVSTGESVIRERRLPGAVLTRVAQSHVRVGTFEYFATQGDHALLKRLADYVIERHYPECNAEADAQQKGNPYRQLLECVIERQAKLIARWMQLGFIHGVMNTDNMQVVGETIDFGPCAFMEAFDAETVLSSIDRQGRYAWCNQPGIGQWNLTRLAEALLPLLAEDQDQAIESAKEALSGFGPAFNHDFLNGFREKLGLGPAEAESVEAAHRFLEETFAVLTAEKVDFTRFFRELVRVASGQGDAAFQSLFANPEAGVTWLRDWHAQFESGQGPDAPAIDRMKVRNPIYIPRNHRVEQAIRAGEEGDFGPFERLVEVLRRPYDEQPELAEYEAPAAPGEEVRQTFCGT